MPHFAPAEMASAIARDLLSFPITHMKADLSFDEGPYRSHLNWIVDQAPAAVFAAGGTGEFFCLSPDEVETVVRTAVDEVKGVMPVVSAAGYGTAMAIDLAGRAERAGADGILLFPPYLVNASQAGLAAHVEAVCKATSLGVIVYNRDNAILDAETVARLCERCPNLVGLKDGVGDIELMVRTRSLLDDRLVYLGGLPTAETFARPY
ncbi:MAG: 5-dehydro-4-deoxyglucarate dehydratase, partial [Devosia sp.]|nr:5-dehydro-4-deoxyglucarate dehydratase [Devosia sp.]